MISQRRVEKLRKLLVAEKVDGVLVSSVSNIVYLTGYSNFSKEERDAYLLISEKQNLLVTHSLLAEELRQIDHGFEVMELTAQIKIKEVFVDFAKKNKIKKLGVEESDLKVSEFKRFSEFFPTLVDFNLEGLRELKDEEEVGKIKRACEIGDEVFEEVLKYIKLGVSERELSWELEKITHEKGAELSFRSIVSFGRNCAIPHHKSDDTKLQKNQFVLMDFGVRYENYCSDMTRTVFFGAANKEQKKIYEVVKGSQGKAVSRINLEILRCAQNDRKMTLQVGSIDKAARDYILEKGYPTIPHSVGHGIGIEVHEVPHVSPNRTELLEVGMVFSIEPGIYIEGFGGVRIEDLYYFDGKSLEQLTNSKRELIELM